MSAVQGEGDETWDSSATSSHLPALMEPHEREALGHELEATLHDMVNLTLIGKQLDWVVVGQLGYFPDGQAQAVAAGSEIGPVMRGPIEDHAVVWELTNRIATVSERARRRMDRLGEINAASQDVLIDVVRELEEQQGMLRAQLAGRS